MAGVMGKRPLEESGSGLLLFIREYLGVAAPGMGIDGDVQVLPADTPGTAGEVAVDSMAHSLDLAELLDVEVQESTWFGDLVTPRRFLLLQRGPLG